MRYLQHLLNWWGRVCDGFAAGDWAPRLGAPFSEERE